MGKRVPIELFRLQNRAGMGLKALKFRLDDDSLVAVLVVNESEELMLVTNRGIIIRQRVNDISIQSRSAQGVRLQRLDEDDAIAAVAVVPAELEEDEMDGEDTETEGAAVDTEGVATVAAADADITTVDTNVTPVESDVTCPDESTDADAE
ncbi:MAG: DNA gyrase C-terminal beta-propeller domain-containing protein, partial [Pseudomonadota bacterium]